MKYLPLLFTLLLSLPCRAAEHAPAAIDIVAANAENEEPVYVLKNISTGKVLGTFWDRANETSDFGFESSIVPDFLWSKDRGHVAVSGGASRSRAVSLYKVTGQTLKEIRVPALDEQQAAPLREINDTVAEGTDAVRWQPDGTLLLRFWAAGRVADDTGKQKEANIWADLEISGDKAVIVGTSSEEPSAQPGPPPPYPVAESGDTLATATPRQEGSGEQPPGQAEGLAPDRLIGIHQVTGKNPDGTAYKGTVEIRVVNGIVGLEWKIAGNVSHGNGVLVGMTLGAALDDGIAIYRIVGQAEGQSLIGIWSGAGAATTNHEAILIGNADMTEANLATDVANGTYTSLREITDGQVEGTLTLTGGESAKSARWETGGKTSTCQALSLADGLAILTPSGLSVFEKRIDANGGASLEGKALSGDGALSNEVLIPAN